MVSFTTEVCRSSPVVGDGFVARSHECWHANQLPLRWYLKARRSCITALRAQRTRQFVDKSVIGEVTGPRRNLSGGLPVEPRIWLVVERAARHRRAHDHGSARAQMAPSLTITAARPLALTAA